jgi:circadian clock protein KaiC
LSNSLRLDKVPTGVSGLDGICGGVPRARTTLIVGGPGAGKTALALQIAIQAARTLGEPAIYVAFEEQAGHLVADSATFDWDLQTLIDRERFAIIDARLSPETTIAGRFDLGGLLALVEAKAEAIGSKLIIFDGIDAILALLDHPVAERRELYRLHGWLSEHSFTGLITCKSGNGRVSLVHRYDFLPFIADCVILLDQRADAGRYQRTLRLLKYRGAPIPLREISFRICSGGIETQPAGDSPFEAGRAGPPPRLREQRRKLDELQEVLLRSRIELIQQQVALCEADLAINQVQDSGYFSDQEGDLW